MKVGTATLEITPPLNVPMDGYDYRKKGSEGTHDPLFAKAIVFDNGKTRLGWVIADLIGMGFEITREVRRLASRLTGIPEGNLMVSATHTHGGPSPQPCPEIQADHGAHEVWLQALPGKLAGVLQAAVQDLAPAELRAAQGYCDSVQHNRRYRMKDGKAKMDWESPEPSQVAFRGPVDPVLPILEIRKEGKTCGLLTQFACHSTVLPQENFQVTADWPGAARRHLEKLSGDSHLWTAVAQGCCGDINPKPPRDTFEIVEAKGRLVAEAVCKAFKTSEPVRGEELASTIVALRLPRKKQGLDATPTGEVYEGEVQAFRIGDMAVVGLPGEVFVDIGLALKNHSKFRGTFVGSYATDYDLGYVPTAAEYPAGAYEILVSRTAPAGESLVVEAGKSALGKLF